MSQPASEGSGEGGRQRCTAGTGGPQTQALGTLQKPCKLRLSENTAPPLSFHDDFITAWPLWQPGVCTPDRIFPASILIRPFGFSLWMLLSAGGLSVLQEAVGDCIPVLLLGNKIDNEKEREVPRGLGEQLAKVRRRHFYLCGQGGSPEQSGMRPRALGEAFSESLLGRKQGGGMGVLESWEWSSSCACEISIESHRLQDGAGEG